jgi:RimJ/RimL family protein N-acetyltransferase
MNFPDKYKVLTHTKFIENEYSIIPLRYEDRIPIMKWRNEQIFHLRQTRPLTMEDQNNYFDSVVAQLFDKDQPNQLLISFMENDVCIGYGGLVHINWIDRNAEISFIMDTQLEQDYFEKHWSTFLRLIEKMAFSDLKLHKLTTYAFDLRPHLYPIIEGHGFYKEAILKEHIFYSGSFINVVIHSKINNYE